MYSSQVFGILLAALPAATFAQVAAWAQCGGSGYSGSSTCTSGYACKFVNDYYSQCQPGEAAATSAAMSSTSSSAPAATATGAIKCPIIFDGRVPTGTSLSFFDTSNALFSADYVKGANLKWSDILKLPTPAPSKFDQGGYQAVEVTISDASIFNNQKGFRRAGLQFAADSSSDPSDTGTKTIHFSVKQDSARKLNLTHEYLNVWHETSDYSANQFNFEAGTIIGTSGTDKASFKVLGRTNNIIYSVPIDYDNWQNFAITIDHNANTLKVYYSKGNATLAAVTSAVSNDNSGNGQFQIGMLKKPTGTSDVVNSGYQESNLNEGQIYGGLFVEDSASGCIST